MAGCLDRVGEVCWVVGEFAGFDPNTIISFKNLSIGHDKINLSRQKHQDLFLFMPMGRVGADTLGQR